MKDNRKTIQLLLIFTVIFSIMGGSLAYWNWNTTEGERTNVVFTVTSDFSCAADGGGNITNNDVSLAPTTCTDTSRAIKRKVTVTPTLNRETMTLSMDLWLTINDLGEGLKKSNNFRYVLTTSENSCEEGTIMASGNFKGRKVGNKVNLLTNELYTETPTEPEEYYLYIWLDEEETSSSTMNQTFSLLLGGQCEEVETLKGDAYALLLEGEYFTPVWTDEEMLSYDLKFIRSEEPIIKGSEYDGKVVAEVYSDIETTNFSSNSSVPWINDYGNRIFSIEFKDTIRPISTAHWFYETFYIEYPHMIREVDLTKLDTSQVADMSYMFSGSNIIIVDGVSNWDVSKVSNMSGVFQYLYYLSLDLSNWDVSNVTDMSHMLQSVTEPIGDLSNWDTSNVTNMSYAFVATTPKGMSNWNVSNVTDMSGMLMDTNVGEENLSNWDVSNVANMSDMFFGSIYNLESIINWDVSNVINMSNMFRYANFDEILDLSGWNVEKVAYYDGFNVTFNDNRDDYIINDKIIPPVWKNAYFGVYSETDKSLRIYNDINVPNISNEYKGRVVTQIYLLNDAFNKLSCGNATSIIFEDDVSPLIPSGGLFENCTKVNYVDVTKMDISMTSSLDGLFKDVGSDSSVTTFTIVGLDKWNTSNVTNMYRMFYNMGKNANYTLDLSGWDVSKVTSHSNFDYGVESKIIDPLWK